MSNLRETYQNYYNNKLNEARVNLLEKGVYPFSVFLKEYSETVHAAEQIELLEEVSKAYKSKVPTLYFFVKQTSDVLLENNSRINSIKSSMINYAFISESLRTCVNSAVRKIREKNSTNDSLTSIYGNDAVNLLEFCIKKSVSFNLLEGNSEVVIRNLASELGNLPLKELSNLCESVPSIKLYVSNKVHDELAKEII